jgi:hypothetical protein
MRPVLPLKYSKLGRAIAPQMTDQPIGFLICLSAFAVPFLALRQSFESSLQPCLLNRFPTFRAFGTQRLLSDSQISTIEILLAIHIVALSIYAIVFARSVIRQFSEQGHAPDVLKTAWPRLMFALLSFATLSILLPLFWGPILQAAYPNSMKLVVITILLVALPLSFFVEVIVAASLYLYCDFTYWTKSTPANQSRDEA